MKKLILVIILLGAAWQVNADTSFFIDFQCGDVAGACGNGLSTTSPFSSLNEFADVARAAGDVAFVRRGRASTTNITAVTILSDGTLNNPIVITADYDNLWNDFSTSTLTWTPTFGSKFIASSASSTDFATPNKWIYIASDCYENAFNSPNASSTNPCEFSYEVASSGPSGIDLYLPYKGNKAGSGRTLRVMPSAPQVGTVTQGTQIFTFSTDLYWIFKGLDLRSNNASTASISNNAISFYDMVLQGNGGTNDAMNTGSMIPYFFIKKIRFYNFDSIFLGPINITMIDFYSDCNNVANSEFLSSTIRGGTSYFINGEVVDCVNLYAGNALGSPMIENIHFINVKNNNIFTGLTAGNPALFFFEDNFGTIGLNSQTSNQISANSVSTTTISTTSNLRLGGGPNNLLVFPPGGNANTGISTKNFPFSYIKLFEYPIYTNTTSRTYTMYFNSTSTAAWVQNPFTNEPGGATSTPEMFIECEFYNDATDADRILTRSTTTNAINFTGSTDWQSLAVTCKPSRTGILYLRGWYAKPKETSRNNWFFMDTTPTITTP